MNDLRTAAQQALEALIWTTGSADFGEGGQAREGALKLLFPSIDALRAALKQEEEASAWLAERKEHWRKEREKAQAAKDQDPELSAALGWPGGISNPVLDRRQLLQMVAALRVSAQQALEALHVVLKDDYRLPYEKIVAATDALNVALAEPEGGGNLPPPLQEPTVAENATTQQQLEDTPPSDYRRGYWDGFNIGKREGRIEAEDALAEPVFEVGFGWLDDATKYPKGTKLYTAPPQRKPLTEEELDELAMDEDGLPNSHLEFARAVERAHGIGGSNE